MKLSTRVHFVKVHCGGKRNITRCTSDPEKVTCGLCRQYMAAHQVPAAPFAHEILRKASRTRETAG